MFENTAHSAHEIQSSAKPRSSSGTSTSEHFGDGYHGIPQQEYFIPHKDMYLRKGKWTTEEERYANKVIEYFNAGVLKLDDHERGITLRAYLAQKLGCDPMRITKKYTGASCLGKRVYHAFKQGGKSEEVDNATADLNVLEDDFRSRLQQLSKRRGGNYSETMLSSTPGIDPMLHQARFPSGWDKHPGTMYGYTMPSYKAGGLKYNKPQHQRHHEFQQVAGYSGQSSEASPHTSPLEQLSRSARSYSSDQTTAPDCSPSLIMALRHNASTGNDLHWDQPAISSDSRARSGAHRKGSEGSTSSGGSSSSTNVNVTAHRRNTPSGAGETRSPSGPECHTPGLLQQRVKVSAHDSEAASSLLGFFTQLERNGSQEDMLHFFEGVQKTVAAVHLQSPAAQSGTVSGAGSASRVGSVVLGGGGGDRLNSQGHDFPPLPPPAYMPNA